MEHTDSFGYWLRRRRRALDLTQAELAGRAFCSAATIRKLEADERRPSAELAKHLARALAVPTHERERFLRAARGVERVDKLGIANAPTTHLAQPRAAGNLPAAPNALVGRSDELGAIGQLLRRPITRLLTLVGPGGVGKTRLAIAAAERERRHFAGGAWFVDLAPLRDPGHVLSRLVQILGLEEQGGASDRDRLAQVLRQRSLLLVLDNFEHLLDAAGELAPLLEAAPGLKLLATSRSALNLRAEQLFAVKPFVAPDLDGVADPAQAIASSDAVQLFVDRAQAASYGFVLSEVDAPAVAAICRRLDGLPLALELAAVHTRRLAPAALLAQLEAPLTLLVGGPRDLPPRQQTLQALIAWSCERLTPQQQALFARASVFAGGWSETCLAELWARAEGRTEIVGPLLTTLVEQSLVEQAAGGSSPRYRMLETIRDYASELLESRGETGRLYRQHAELYCRLVAPAPAALRRSGLQACLQLLDAEHDNLRVALRWSLGNDPGLALRLAADLAPYWAIRGYRREGTHWIEQALVLAPDAPAELRARALTGAGELNAGLGRIERSDQQLAASLALWDELGLRERSSAAAYTLIRQAVNAWSQRGDKEAQGRLARAALAIGERTGDAWIQGRALAMLAGAYAHQGDRQASCRLNERALALFEALGDPLEIWRARYHLVVWGEGSLREQEADLEGLLADIRAGGSISSVSRILNQLGEVTRAQGKLDRAAEHYGAALAEAQRLGDEADELALFNNLLWLNVQRGELGAAAHQLRHCLERVWAWSGSAQLWFTLMGAALLAEAISETETAARLWGFGEPHFAAARLMLADWDLRWVEQVHAAAAARLGPTYYATLLGEGRRLGRDQALMLAWSLLAVETTARVL